MKRVILCAVAVLGLSACAVPVELKESQAVERQALRDFHKAERQAYRAGEASKVATGAKVAAEAMRMLAEAEADRALEALETEMNKGQ